MSIFCSFNTPIREWRGKTAWIIGASSGIGRAVAVALLDAGAHVAVSARDQDALETLATGYPHGRVTVLPLDVNDMEALAAAHARLVQIAAIDLLLYCAGYYKGLRAFVLDREEMLRHQQVNYVGAINVLAAVLPTLQARGAGHVSLVASVAGYRGLPMCAAYGPTKAALTHLAEAMYIDLHPLGIDVSVIQPGFVETPLTDDNEFRMPALIKPTEAATAMLDGWSRGAFEIHFPKRFTWIVKFMRLLPYRLYFPLIRKLERMYLPAAK
ncbi:MAG: SDR family NAD(P)-dependent oxidoreductase [Variovorax sp.]